MTVGSYHFCRHDLHSSLDGARAEARFYVKAMLRIGGHELHAWRKGNFLPILDFERKANQVLSKWRDAFFDEVRRLVGHNSILYCSPGFNNWGPPKVRDNRMWVAEYGVSSPKAPPGYKSWDLWQYTEHGRLNGISGDVDISKLPSSANGKLSRLICNNDSQTVKL
jgi:lysozyme